MLKKGFTLIELLVVIAIIGILSSIGIPMYTDYKEKARENVSIINHKNFIKYISNLDRSCKSGSISQYEVIASDGQRSTHNCDVAAGWQTITFDIDAVLSTYNANCKNPWGSGSNASSYYCVFNGTLPNQIGYSSIRSSVWNITVTTQYGKDASKTLVTTVSFHPKDL